MFHNTHSRENKLNAPIPAVHAVDWRAVVADAVVLIYNTGICCVLRLAVACNARSKSSVWFSLAVAITLLEPA